MELDLIYEDNHLLAINKPSGMLVQGDKTNDKCILDFAKAYIKKKYNKPGDVFIGLPHRLDRPTSGVIVLARTSKALERLNKQFHDKLVQKTYWAVVGNNPPEVEGTLVHYMTKSQEKNRSYAHKKVKKGGQLAELDYKLIGKSKLYNLLKITPKTGRHHQIRVQLSSIGCPIKGDIKYGFKRSNPDKSIHLHARTISFTHPTTKETMKFTAKAPNEVIWNVFKDIKA
ncbi:MAG: RluA family pseudouridine synthase [Chitinophagales bacterium]